MTRRELITAAITAPLAGLVPETPAPTVVAGWDPAFIQGDKAVCSVYWRASSEIFYLIQRYNSELEIPLHHGPLHRPSQSLPRQGALPAWE